MRRLFLWHAARRIRRHVVTVQPCTRKHNGTLGDAGNWTVAVCSVCGVDEESCTTLSHSDTDAHRADLMGGLRLALDVIEGAPRG
jgi:hypothetical protein